MTEVSDPPVRAAESRAQPRLLEMARKVQEFLISLIIFHFLPLSPLLIEWLRSGRVEESNFVLGVAIFAISTGFSSRYKLVFTIAVTYGLILSSLLGKPSEGDHPPFTFGSIAWTVLAAVSVMHTAERVARHLYRNENALLFENRRGAA